MGVWVFEYVCYMYLDICAACIYTSYTRAYTCTNTHIYTHTNTHPQRELVALKAENDTMREEMKTVHQQLLKKHGLLKHTTTNETPYEGPSTTTTGTTITATAATIGIESKGEDGSSNGVSMADAIATQAAEKITRLQAHAAADARCEWV